MKKILLLLSSLICLIPVFPASQGNAMLPMPSEEEMKEIQKFLDTLSPEELDELAKIGEEIIQTAEKEGRPLFGPAPTTQPTPKPVKPETTTHTLKETKQQKPAERVLSSKEKSRIQRVLSGLVDTIASIYQKAASDETLLQLIAPINVSLNDLTYYLNVINYSKHLVHLTDAEFTPLNDNLRKLYEQLDELDSELEVPEVKVEKQSTDEIKKQRQQTKRAAQILNKFVSMIETAIKQKHVLTDLERLVKKYEPEAFKIKKEQEEKEKKANTQRTSLPVTNIPHTYNAPIDSSKPTQQYTTRPSGSGGSYAGSSYGPASQSRVTLPGKTNASLANKTTPTNQKKDTDKDKKKDTKETLVKQTESEKTQELEQKIQDSMDRINKRVGFFKPDLLSFIDTALSDTKPIPAEIGTHIKNIFEEASFDLGRIQKDVTSWVTKISNQAESAQEYRTNKERLKTYMEKNMKDIHEIHQKVKNNTSSPYAEEYNETLKSFTKHVDDIKKALNKTL